MQNIENCFETPASFAVFISMPFHCSTPIRLLENISRPNLCDVFTNISHKFNTSTYQHLSSAYTTSN